jgi:hypothetical protein
MIESQRRSYEAITDSFIEFQKRNVRFAQSGMDLVKLGEENSSAVQDFWASSMRLMGLGQRNAQFFQSWMSGGADYLRNQAEHNQNAAEALAQSARVQQEGLRKLGEDWAGISEDVASTTRSYAEEGMQNARKATDQGLQAVQEMTEQTAEQTEKMALQAAPQVGRSELPIKNYDDLSVSEVAQRLNGLSDNQLQKVRTYEKQNRDRDTLVAQIDQKMKSA